MRFLAFTLCQVLFAQEANTSIQSDKIASLIQIIKTGDHSKIVGLIKYPLPRDYPLNSVPNHQACLKRFDEVFDKAFLEELTNCSPQEDWQEMGWRGIMFKNGSLWLDFDYKIIAVNHETAASQRLIAKAIEQQKMRLPESLRDFDQPQLEWNTQLYLVRVDRKKEDYRLAILDVKSPTKILLTLHNGAFHFDGSMGAYFIDWHSEGKTHRIYSGASSDDDSYLIYNSLVGESDLPGHPAEEHKRRKK